LLADAAKIGDIVKVDDRPEVSAKVKKSSRKGRLRLQTPDASRDASGGFD